ncbi:MAG: tRNA (adenosine(37)-N6)-threonylcarbamoyltransferase complex ATPase subunit type 1 TsaE [Gammaproteobacteria bacterium]|jgi:tRNA threonylcarbamoyladenosine biosynthesis protein TsaE|nr:MAG: tRNA (adenosine(37)-N6)-threonylcarbamoyltransferase complex ATPase subunit type 1 TsaE [Gammaproteobacteria bacterium]PHR83272.1 MAG: tRNA (adenosine(37)-N6)-threonylcarbamoyltransferase complex ATPase subunit type 1 TsaE [Colwellia sp.]
MKQLEYFLADESATIAVGTGLARVLLAQDKHINKARSALVVYLNGDLGAGKTTLTRGFVRGMGHQGKVKSPTYTLVEPYELSPWQVYHFDLYRLSDAEELEYMGIRDYFAENCCCFIEWPEKGAGILPKADIVIQLDYQDEQRTVELRAFSARGEDVLQSYSSRQK